MPVGSSEKQDGRRTTSAIDGRGPEGPGAEPVRDHEGSSEAAVAGQPVVVRRNAGVAALVLDRRAQVQRVGTADEPVEPNALPRR